MPKTTYRQVVEATIGQLIVDVLGDDTLPREAKSGSMATVTTLAERLADEGHYDNLREALLDLGFPPMLMDSFLEMKNKDRPS